MECFGDLRICYRIGPELFYRTYAPNASVHLSSALPGGDNDLEAVLTSVKAADLKDEVAEAAPLYKLPVFDRMFLLLRTFALALSPLMLRALDETQTSGGLLESKRLNANLWGDDGDRTLDAEGVLAALRELWPCLGRGDFPYLVDGFTTIQASCDELLHPLESLATAWVEQAEMLECDIGNATSAASNLLNLFGMATAAAEAQKYSRDKRGHGKGNKRQSLKAGKSVGFVK